MVALSILGSVVLRHHESVPLVPSRFRVCAFSARLKARSNFSCLIGQSEMHTEAFTTKICFTHHAQAMNGLSSAKVRQKHM